MGKYLFGLVAFAAVAVPVAVARAEGDDVRHSGFLFTASQGFGAGLYHYLSGAGTGGETDWSAFAMNTNLCIGGHGDVVGGGFHASFTPMLDPLTSDLSPSGSVGACLAIQAAPVFRLDLTAGFGAEGTNNFGGIGPVWSAGFTFSLARVGESSFDLGARAVVGYLWEPETETHDPGAFISPTLHVGYGFW